MQAQLEKKQSRTNVKTERELQANVSIQQNNTAKIRQKLEKLRKQTAQAEAELNRVQKEEDRARIQERKKKNALVKERNPKGRTAIPDTSLNTPTPPMLAILERMRNKEETLSLAMPSKRKRARFDLYDYT